jgi:flagellar hook protein FlgE
MMRALQSGVTGLLAHQVRMDTVGNNIANADTVGFKEGRTLFTDTLYENLRPASGATATRGSVNPMDVGSGVRVASTDTKFTQGALQATGRSTDVAIEGEGFLAVTDGSATFLTRNGALGIDGDGNLIHLATNLRVVATPSDSSGPVGASSTLTLPVGQSGMARATGTVTLTGNVDSRLDDGATQGITATVYDSLGAPRNLTLTLTRSGSDWNVSGGSADGTVTVGTPSAIAFDTAGKPTIATVPLTMNLTGANGANGTLSIALNTSGLTQLAQAGTAALSGQDGLPPGSLTSVTVRSNGVIEGIYSNGLTRSVGQLVTGTVANKDGLEAAGGSLFKTTASSGEVAFGTPGAGGRGAVRGGNLEGSNVDLAGQFTDMIVTQRGYQASSRVISTADQMLQDLLQVLR